MDKLHIKQIRIIIAFVGFIALFTCCAKSKTDLDKDGYHGNIHEVIEFHCSISDGELEKSYISHSITYNKDGYKTEEVGAYLYSELKDIYKYDSNNKLIEMCTYAPIDSLWFKHIYKYDSNNNMIEEYEYNGKGELCSKQTYTYDANNNMIETKSYSPYYSHVTQRETYEYDSNNNMIKKKYKNGTKHIYKYDSNNNLIEECSYNQDGTLENKQTNKYDSNKNLIEKCYYNSDGSLKYKYTYKYDSNNNRIEEYYLSGEGKLTGGKIIEYKYW